MEHFSPHFRGWIAGHWVLTGPATVIDYALYHFSISFVKSAWLLAADSFIGAYHVALTPCSQAGTYVH